MAVINAGNLSLLDLAKRMDPSGAIAPIVELMTRKNPLLRDMVWKEGKLPTGHQFTHRTGLPTPEWRKLNAGVSAQKSKTDQIVETCGILSSISKVDRDLAKVGGNEAAARLSEDVAFLQGFDNVAESAFFYEDTATTPEAIKGFASRLNSLSGPYPKQILDAGMGPVGADQASVWIVGWGDETVYGIVPKGMPAGLQREDLGKQLVKDSNNKEFVAWVTEWSWRIGLCVQDAEYLVRICNIDMSNIAATGNLLIQALVKGVRRMKSLEGVKPVIYMPREVITFLELQALDSTKNSTLTYKDVGGMPMPFFRGIPVRQSDALLLTESIVT